VDVYTSLTLLIHIIDSEDSDDDIHKFVKRLAGRADDSESNFE